MKGEIVKFLSLCIISTIIMSSTQVFAATAMNNTNQNVATTQLTKKSILLTDSKFKMIGSKVFYNRYTYANAPTDVKTQYDADCKAVNKIPSPLDTIDVPVTQSVSGNVDTTLIPNTITYNIVFNGTDTIQVTNSSTDGHRYYCFINTDIVGYGHETSGDSVVCLQALLNKLGYTTNVDGIFGSQTQSGVLSFQTSHGLSADGIVGANTWNTMLVAIGL